jgi:hypothetical protein
MSRYRFIEAQRGQHPVRLLCQVLGVPTSGYYAWQQVQQQAVAQGEPAWEAALVKVFGRHQRRYGTRRLQVALRRKGYRVGPQRLRGACGAGACTRCSIRPSPPARPTRRTDFAAPPTDCSSSPSLPRLPSYGSAISPTYRWPTATGLICARTRTWSASRWWAGTSWPPCPRN